ncbi:unnamed protein product [Parascedosporium putredinis]|uniref:Mei2-like C-terminal RNA recognition motif domain-containing protein n=1 Tax=Parascedosporium putredinis TaxID=1442378 RepID=A0A9P1M7L4_9PEZI|nr:unnamed protein product [Parascedosporium putredinis]CAI7988521.1 unnamed protein product [Parascedosporium putredinis]
MAVMPQTSFEIMLRNIPNKVEQAMLKQIVDESSWGKYDFMYLRIDFANDCNVGYAFINFVDPLDIVDFMKARGNQRCYFIPQTDLNLRLQAKKNHSLNQTTSLFTPNAGQHFRNEQRRRRSQYDRGTRLAAIEEFDYEVSLQQRQSQSDMGL